MAGSSTLAGKAAPRRSAGAPASTTSGGRWGRLPRWLGLLLVFRALSAATAVALLSVHRVTDFDGTLIIVVAAYTVGTAGALIQWPGLVHRPPVWIADVTVVYVLLFVSGDWRSPFYLLALTSLALPAAALGTRAALVLGAAYTLAYGIAARIIGPDPLALGTQASVETLATHLVLPGLICLGIGYAAETLRRLEQQRVRAERLAIETERRRIAWELHDSAKQRVHAAHLVLSSLAGSEDPRTSAVVEQVLGELQAASADMDTSLAELRAPLVGRPLGEALRERAEALSVESGPRLEVRGEIPSLGPVQTAHAYRIAAEALTNAIRHAEATLVEVHIRSDGEHAEVVVSDDGRGMPLRSRPGSTGMLAMRNRARTIQGSVRIAPAGDRGTAVTLRFPLGLGEDDAA